VLDRRPIGKSWRYRVEEAGILAGVRFARDRCQHQWANTLALADGEGVPVWTWREIRQLPENGPTRPVKRSIGLSSGIGPCRLNLTSFVVFKTVRKLIADVTGSLTTPTL
jgi:hypothetical protein